jgi:TadE-like protein
MSRFDNPGPDLRATRPYAAARSRARRKAARRTRSESGAAVVEGAMIFGLFFFLLFAIIEFGLFFMSWNTGRNAATEAAHQAAIVGKASDADYAALLAVRGNLERLGPEFDYMIVFRANGIKDQVPQACVAAAEAGRGVTDPFVPTGVFQFSDGTGPKTVETFNWSDNPRPEVACNVYYRRHLTLPDGAFRYDRDNVDKVPSEPSLDRFWPGGFRVDRMNGPVDFLGIHIATTYGTATGLLSNRRFVHTSIIQIESRRAV